MPMRRTVSRRSPIITLMVSPSTTRSTVALGAQSFSPFWGTAASPPAVDSAGGSRALTTTPARSEAPVAALSPAKSAVSRVRVLHELTSTNTRALAACHDASDRLRRRLPPPVQPSEATSPPSGGLASARSRGARSRGARSRGARSRGARWCGARWRGARSRGARWCGARWRGARSRGARWRGARSRGARWRRGVLGASDWGDGDIMTLALLREAPWGRCFADDRWPTAGARPGDGRSRQASGCGGEVAATDGSGAGRCAGGLQGFAGPGHAAPADVAGGGVQLPVLLRVGPAGGNDVYENQLIGHVHMMAGGCDILSE